MDAVHEQHGIISDPKRLAARRNDQSRAEQTDKQHTHVEGDLHQGIVEHKDLLRASEAALHLARRLFELLGLIILAHERFHDADPLDVLLDGFVEVIIFMKDLFEDRHDLTDDRKKPESKQRHDPHVDESHGAAHDKRHRQRKNEHQRRPHGDSNDHHERLLDVGHVRRQSCHKA